MLQLENSRNPSAASPRCTMSRSTFAAGSLTGDDRAERRRQDHVLQSDLRRLRARPRPGHARRRGHRAACRPTPDRAPRHRARVPDRQHFSVADGRETLGPRCRRTAAAKRIMLRAFPAARSRGRADEVMTMLGLRRGRGHPRPQLSARRPETARYRACAGAGAASVLLLDEPTAGMGPEERWQMIEKVQELWRASEA